LTKVIISHPTGNEFSKAAVKSFYSEDILQSYYTGLASFPGTFLYQIGSIKALSDIKRRSVQKELRHYVHTHPFKELMRLLSIKAGNKKLIEHETGFFSVDAVYKNLDKYVSKKLVSEKHKGASVMYAYEDGAYHSFKKAKALGLKCVYDLPIGYWRSMHDLLSKEKEINPEWAMTLSGLQDSKNKLQQKDEEIGFSDTIIVASSFTAKTLDDYPGKLPSIKIIPYGFPPVSEKRYNSSNKIKLLFVGGLSQRKGLSYMFKALDAFDKRVSLTVIGRMPQCECKVLNEYLKKHTYIPTLPHKKILEQMQAHDILILPSLFEGFGLVISEAMAQGTPVITTEKTAGPDIIQHENNGWLATAGSVESLKNILENLLAKPSLVKDAGIQAAATAKKRTWNVYGKELCDAVRI
jgi:glycosyltransferase involved in cell wall biosynthesis